MIRYSLITAFLASLLVVGCNSSPPSYPEPANDAETKKAIAERDNKVSDEERAREKAAAAK